MSRKIGSPLPKDAARLVVNTYSIWCMETTAAEIAAAAFRIEDESKNRILGRPDRGFGGQSRSDSSQKI